VIIRRIIFALVGASILAASAAVCMVALAFALFAAVEPTVGRAGAAAVVAGTAAVMVALVAVGFLLGSRGKKPPPPTGKKVLERSLDYVKENPYLVIAAAVGAGLLAVRNPEYVGSAIRAFIEGRPAKR